MDFDVIIRQALVVDGTTGSEVNDVGLTGDTITGVGHLDSAAAPTVIDASGLVLTPGFIDVHTHSDYALLYNPPAQSHVAQGITTEIIGNCGYSAFPRVPSSRGLMLDPPGVDGSWSTAEEFFSHARGVPGGVNALSLAGHTTIRAAIVGRDDRPATSDELTEMQDSVRTAMEAGAVGLSTGLDYAPGGAADVDELVALCAVVAEYGGIYTSHLRGYADTVMSAIEEALLIGRRARLPVQLSHLHAFGRSNWGIGESIVKAIEKARQDGIDVTADVLAYPTVGAWWGPRAVFPDDVYDWRRGRGEALANLLHELRSHRDQLRKRVEQRRVMPKHGFHEVCGIFSNWGDIYVTSVSEASSSRELIGSSIQDISATDGREPVDIYFDLVEAEGTSFGSIHSTQRAEDFNQILSAEWCMVSTDTVATDPERLGQPFNVLQQHPRGWATYARLFEKFVHKDKLLTLEEAVRKVTELPAKTFGISGRGTVATGMSADLVLLDTATLRQRASYVEPCQFPAGIRAVFVNGQTVVNGGTPTGSTPAGIQPLTR